MTLKQILVSVASHLDRGTWKAWLLVLTLATAIGFAITFEGINFIDDATRLKHSNDVLKMYGLLDGNVTGISGKYATLFELFLGIASWHVFGFLLDPYWVRHACTFGFYLLSLYACYILLRRSQLSKAHALLCTAGVLGIIRLGGHALFNMKDVPGALGFLLTTLMLWVLFRGGREHGFSMLRLVTMAIVSLVPFLLRAPLLLHAGFFGMFLVGYIVFYDKKMSLQKKIAIAIVAAAAFMFCLCMLYPMVWRIGPVAAIQKAIRQFSAFNWNFYEVRMFHQEFSAKNLPWWYAPAWIPVIVHPFVFVSMVIGLMACVVQACRSRLRPSLTLWVALCTIAAWLTVILLRPTLYNEERQILFLFPTLVVLGMLGLQWLPNVWKGVLAIIFIAGSLWSYGQWQQFSYIYQSPIIGAYEPDRFHGDYWGICASVAVDKLVEHVPQHMTVFVDSDFGTAYMEKLRYEKSLFFRDDRFTYDLRHSTFPYTGDYALITGNTPYSISHYFNSIDALIKQGTATLLWEFTLPNNKPICRLAYMPEDAHYEMLASHSSAE